MNLNQWMGLGGHVGNSVGELGYARVSQEAEKLPNIFAEQEP